MVVVAAVSCSTNATTATGISMQHVLDFGKNNRPAILLF